MAGRMSAHVAVAAAVLWPLREHSRVAFVALGFVRYFGEIALAGKVVEIDLRCGTDPCWRQRRERLAQRTGCVCDMVDCQILCTMALAKKREVGWDESVGLSRTKSVMETTGKCLSQQPIVVNPGPNSEIENGQLPATNLD